MADHPNAVLIREGLSAFNSGQIDRFAEHVADDVVWHIIGEDEPLRGKEALIGGSGSMTDRDYSVTMEVHDVVANDDHAVALVEATAVRGGETLVYQTAEIFHVRDGKITERWAFSDDTARILAFFA